MTKRAAVFIENYALGRCSVALCVLEMISADHEIDLYFANVWLGDSPAIRAVTRALQVRPEDGGWLRHAARVIRHPSRCGSLLQRIRTSWRARTTRYDLYLVFDPHGFLRCCSFFPFAQPFYFSLELYFRTNAFNLDYPEDVMRREHAAINRIRGLLIQSSERDALFREEYELRSDIPTFLLPVAQAGASVTRKSSLLRTRFGISATDRVLLHLGAIAPFLCCLEMLRAFKDVEGWSMVFHGHPYAGYIDELRAERDRLGLAERVFISSDVIADVGGIDDVVSSADAGICWYADVSPNFSTAGRSSGKIAAYLRSGLPVITNGYPSSRSAIEDTGCGVCIDSLADLPRALARVTAELPRFSANAFREYEATYRFDVYRESLRRFFADPSPPAPAA